MSTVYDHDLTGWMKQSLRAQRTLSFHALCAGKLSNRQAREWVDYLFDQLHESSIAMRGQHRSQDLEISFALGGGCSEQYAPEAFYDFILDSALHVCEERSIKVVSDDVLPRALIHLPLCAV